MRASIVSVAVVALIVGFAFGALAFPPGHTVTTTVVLTPTIPHQPETVTLTAEGVLIVYVSGVCTTRAGTLYVIYTQFPGNQLTSITTIHSGTFPQVYYATVASEQTNTVVTVTQAFTGAC